MKAGSASLDSSLRPVLQYRTFTNRNHINRRRMRYKVRMCHSKALLRSFRSPFPRLTMTSLTGITAASGIVSPPAAAGGKGPNRASSSPACSTLGRTTTRNNVHITFNQVRFRFNIAKLSGEVNSPSVLNNCRDTPLSVD